MNAPQNLFLGNLADIGCVDVNLPVAQHVAENHIAYYESFGNAVKASNAGGDAKAAAVYSFISILCGFCENFDTPQAPYSALAVFDNRRTAIPSDLTPTDVSALKLLAAATTDPALRGRLHDVLWVAAKDVAAGHDAVRSYLAAGKIQNSDESWVYAVSSFKRALSLAAGFGRQKPLFNDAVNGIEEAIDAAKSSQDEFRQLKLIRLLWRAKSGAPAIYAPMLGRIATQAEANGRLRCALLYREHEAEWHLAAGNRVAAQIARMAAAEAGVKNAEARASSQGGSALAASALLTEAIEMLRRAGAPKARVDAVRQRLREFQLASLEEMKSFNVPVDITKPIEESRLHVRSENFREALAKFVLGVPLLLPTMVRQEVENNVKAYPLSQTFQKSHVDAKGRTVAVHEGLLSASRDEAESALQGEIFAQARIAWTLRTQAFITPAREEILADHCPSFDDLAFLVERNPFVPPGHEGILLRGLHAGFHGDFIVSAHLLTPQIENSIRYVLEGHGVDVSNFNSDGTQPVKILGALLDLPETTKYFGEDLVFEFRGCLIEKTGFDLRNRVAHGFVNDVECLSEGPILSWWLILRLCLWPHLLVETAAPPASA
jgi:hypothetical protein